MTLKRFGPTFPRLFTAALLQELSFSFLIHAPGYLNQLGASEGMIGVLYSACAVASLLVRPLLGRILDLTRRRTVILITGAFNVAALLLLATTAVWGPYLWVLFVVQRVLQLALFTTVLTYAADAIVVSRRTQGLAIFGLSGLIPIAVGGLAGDITINAFGFVGLFIAAAIASSTAWYFFFGLPTLSIRSPEDRRNFWSALAQRNLLPLWLATLLFSIGLEALFVFTRTYVQTQQIGTTGLFFGTYGLVAAVTRISGGRLYDRIPHRPLLVSAIAVYGLGLVAMAIADGVPVFVLAAGLTGFAHGVAFPLLSSQVVNRARQSERGSAMSVFTSIFDVALLAGAPVVGLLIDVHSYLVAFAATGLTLILGAVLYWWWDRWLVGAESASVLGEKAG